MSYELCIFCTVKSCLHGIFYDLNLEYVKIRCRYKSSLNELRFLCKGNSLISVLLEIFCSTDGRAVAYNAGGPGIKSRRGHCLFRR